jgi:hypothetical protein
MMMMSTMQAYCGHASALLPHCCPAAAAAAACKAVPSPLDCRFISCIPSAACFQLRLPVCQLLRCQLLQLLLRFCIAGSVPEHVCNGAVGCVVFAAQQPLQQRQVTFILTNLKDTAAAAGAATGMTAMTAVVEGQGFVNMLLRMHATVQYVTTR